MLQETKFYEDNRSMIYLAIFIDLLVTIRFLDNDIGRLIMSGLLAIAFFIVFYYSLKKFSMERKCIDKMIMVKNVALFLMIVTLLFSFAVVSAIMSPGKYFLLWDMFNQGFLYYYYLGACLVILFVFSWIVVNKEIEDRNESFDFAVWLVFIIMGLIALGVLVSWFMIDKIADTVAGLMNKEIGF